MTVSDSAQSQVREALQRLIDAVEAVGEGNRYWPREMRLDSTADALETALDHAIEVLRDGT